MTKRKYDNIIVNGISLKAEACDVLVDVPDPINIFSDEFKPRELFAHITFKIPIKRFKQEDKIMKMVRSLVRYSLS